MYRCSPAIIWCLCFHGLLLRRFIFLSWINAALTLTCLLGQIPLEGQVIISYFKRPQRRCCPCTKRLVQKHHALQLMYKRAITKTLCPQALVHNIVQNPKRSSLYHHWVLNSNSRKFSKNRACNLARTSICPKNTSVPFLPSSPPK